MLGKSKAHSTSTSYLHHQVKASSDHPDSAIFIHPSTTVPSQDPHSQLIASLIRITLQQLSLVPDAVFFDGLYCNVVVSRSHHGVSAEDYRAILDDLVADGRLALVQLSIPDRKRGEPASGPCAFRLVDAFELPKGGLR
jgi:hypothetical protein